MQLEEWHDYFVAQAGASAAIAGLLFVALSINIDRIIKMPWLPPRAATTMLLLVGSLVEALLALWARQTEFVVGLEIFIVSLGVGGYTIVLLSAASKMPKEYAGYTLQSIIVVHVAAIPAVAGGLALVLGFDAGIYAIAFAMIMAIVVAIVVAFLNSWVLLVEILR
jgi:hypothetical protein